MDYLNEFKRTQNNLENRTQNKNFTLEYGRAGSEGRRPEEQEANMPYSYGDRIIIGTIPGGSVITKATTLVVEGFDAGTTIDLDFSLDQNLTLVPLVPETLLVDESLVAINAPLNNIGNRDAAGVLLPAGDPLATVWLGFKEAPGDYYIVATFGGGTGELSVGHLDVVVEYNRFGTNEGAY